MRNPTDNPPPDGTCHAVYDYLNETCHGPEGCGRIAPPGELVCKVCRQSIENACARYLTAVR